MIEKTCIAFGVQSGDVVADETMKPFYMALRQNFADHCQGAYLPDFDKIGFVIRIDGDIWHFDFEGFEKIRIQKKSRVITADIGVTKRIWQGATADIKRYLAETILECLEAIVKKLRSAKIDVDDVGLKRDFHKAIDAFLHEDLN